MASSNPSRLLNLPLDISKIVNGYLSFPENALLKITCKAFHNHTPFHYEHCLEAERTYGAYSLQVYACSGCHRLRHAFEYADDMIRHDRARGAVNARSRFCIDCGIAPPEKTQIKGYDPGEIIRVDGVQFVICKECRRCNFPGDYPEEGLCVRCWDDEYCQAERLAEVPQEKKTVW